MMSTRLKQSGLWFVLVAVLMAAQLALAFHSLEHKFEPALAQGHDCALCQVASTMAPEAAADSVVLPGFFAILKTDISGTPFLRAAASHAGFRARAPPVSVSV